MGHVSVRRRQAIKITGRNIRLSYISAPHLIPQWQLAAPADIGLHGQGARARSTSELTGCQASKRHTPPSLPRTPSCRPATPFQVGLLGAWKHRHRRHRSPSWISESQINLDHIAYQRQLQPTPPYPSSLKHCYTRRVRPTLAASRTPLRNGVRRTLKPDGRVRRHHPLRQRAVLSRRGHIHFAAVLQLSPAGLVPAADPVWHHSRRRDQPVPAVHQRHDARLWRAFRTRGSFQVRMEWHKGM